MDELSTLAAAQVDEILDLADACERADGTAPLAEHARLALRHGAEGFTHLLLRAGDGMLTGYAYVETSSRTAESHGTPSSSELCVHPGHRMRGLGGSLVARVAAAAPVRVWAHGDHPSAGALAQHYGLTAERLLYRMRRRLDDVDGAVAMPAGVTVRAFRPGADEESLLAVNARAFSWHPEQGAMSRTDLDRRMSEPWFDPAGLFLAERDGEVVGFHWTKVHSGPHSIGEVYVLGVDPSAQGIGLGRVLTSVGLRHLRSLGLDAVLLYVDESNTAAVRLYERTGFTRWSTDVQYGAERPRRSASRS